MAESFFYVRLKITKSKNLERLNFLSKTLDCMDKFEENLDDFIAKAEKAHELVTLLQSKDLDVVKDTQNQIDNILK